MLSHGYWGHLWGNLAVGLPVMLYLEPKLGTKRFLKAYFLCGLGSMVLFTAMTGGAMVGSSGALFGLTAIACRVYGDNREQRLLAHLVLLLWLIPQFMALAAMDGIAHAGHIGGAITGLLLIYCHKK